MVSEEFGFDKKFKNLVAKYDAVKKESYTIGVLLPFLFDDLSNRDRIMNNSLVTDLYQGMLLANEMLGQQGTMTQMEKSLNKGELK